MFVISSEGADLGKFVKVVSCRYFPTQIFVRVDDLVSMFLSVCVTTEQDDCLAAVILTSLTTLHIDISVGSHFECVAVKTIFIDFHALGRSRLISSEVFYEI
jgi:hypothetical protein